MSVDNKSDKLWYIAKMSLALAMALAYILIGVLVMIKKWFMVELDANISYILGVVLIIYGVYRSYRVVKLLL